ncbi:MAG TPA: NUDIX domain-containing protein [Candidatus Paceibacterota bacterium]
MKTLATFNDETVSENDLKTFQHRQAVRIIVVDSEKNIALLHVVRNNFHELPGGGVEEQETPTEGALRECREEIGCIVEIDSELGTTLEYRKENTLINESVCFTAHVVGEKGLQQLEDDESESEMKVLWVSPGKAIELIKTSVPKNLYDTYVMKRDITFIEAFTA